MSPDYARNFICDFILGKEQNNISKENNSYYDFAQLSLFEGVWE